MHILVTGGAGYIGSVVTAQLIDAGHEVVICDDLSKGNRAAVHPAAELVVGSIGDTALLDSMFRRHAFDAVMHFAAFIEAGESMESPERFFHNNTANALQLLQAALTNRVLRVIFSSTAAVYGDPENIPLRETDRLSPTNAYGESKLMVERMLDWFHRIHGLSYASLRYFNAAGATAKLGELHRPESHLIPLVLQVAQGTRAHICIYGTNYSTPDGTCVRDYIHVSDLAAAHLLSLNALADAGASPKQLIYNLGNGQGFSVRQVIAVARAVTGHSIPAQEAARRAGDPAVLVASSEKIRRELGWIPQFPDLETIIRSAWQWMQSNSTPNA